jgi:type VI secretion system protein ImpA
MAAGRHIRQEGRREREMEEFPDGFDLAALLAPVPGDAPAGTDLRADGSPQALYLRLRDARAEARAAERAMDAGDAEDAGVPPQWRAIRALAVAALAQSKDLEVAAWLTEALLRGDGLLGLAAGARLMAGLVEDFWDALFPLPDEDGIATRVAPLAGLNGLSGDGTLIQPLRKITLFVRPDGAALQFWQYEQSAALSGIADTARRQQRIEAGVLPFETVENEARAAGGAHFATLRRQAATAAAAWQALSDALDRRAGAEAPPTSRVRDLLAQIMAVAEPFAAPEAAAAEPTEPGAAVAAATPPAAATGAVGSREEALRALAAIADYFRRTEPLSPLAYTLQEAVRRARMSWPELLEEIVPDSAVRGAILTSLGIRPPPSE